MQKIINVNQLRPDLSKAHQNVTEGALENKIVSSDGGSVCTVYSLVPAV